MSLPIVVVSMGDPAGIGPEITVKALCDETVMERTRCVVVGDASVLGRAITLTGAGATRHAEAGVGAAAGNRARAAATTPKGAARLNVIQSLEEAVFEPGVINAFDLANAPVGSFTPGEVSAVCGKASFEYVKFAAELCLAESKPPCFSEGAADSPATGSGTRAAVLCTAPINKESLRADGVPYIGHTEMLASLTDTPDPLTLFEVQNLRIFFLTRHVPLRAACDLVTTERVVDYVKRCTAALGQLGVTGGTMAVAGLNPHSGEHGLFGTEEGDAIVPAVERLQKEGYNVVGPVSADSVFHQAHQGRYSAVLSLYHDQGHIAAKTLDFERTISLTCGMPFLRTSVDHGTAFDIAWQNKASPVSMVEALLVAAKYAGNWRCKYAGIRNKPDKA